MKLLKTHGVLDKLDKNDSRYCRSLMKDLILATDVESSETKLRVAKQWSEFMQDYTTLSEKNNNSNTSAADEQVSSSPRPTALAGSSTKYESDEKVMNGFSSSSVLLKESMRASVMRMILLCADVGCMVDPFDISFSWARRLYQVPISF